MDIMAATKVISRNTAMMSSTLASFVPSAHFQFASCLAGRQVLIGLQAV